MNENKLISLCIPTNGKVEFVLPVLESIYSQGVDDSLFEVVITDNGKNSVLGESIEEFKSHGNIFYYKSDLNGFVNQVDSFKRSNGLFIKMLNHRAKLVKGALADLIAIVEKYKESQPCIYCSDGVLSKEELLVCENFDSFVKELSYFSSWSAGVGIWAKDKAFLESIEYNKMFPHISIIFEERLGSKYIVWNKKFMNMSDEPTKGGYNIFYAFAVVYVDLLKDLMKSGRITFSTYKSVKKDLRSFLVQWYYNICVKDNQYTFDTTDMFENITSNYSVFDYLYIVFMAQIKFLSANVKSVLKKCLKFK